ncbi:MAG: DMT family transporter [Rhodoferax sp.]|nr:DMT family transporter [Rhodoferax sp.]
MSHQPRNTVSSGTVLAILAALSWGMSTVMSKGVLDAFAPIFLLVVQLAASVTCLWVMVYVRKKPSQPLSFRTVARFAALGLLEPGLAYLLELIGLEHTQASTSTLILSTESLMIMALSALLFGERLSVRFVLLSLLAVGGLYLALGASVADASSKAMWGNALVFAGSACAALYVVLSARIAADADPITIVAWQQTVALGFALLMLPFEWMWRPASHSLPTAPELWLLAASSGVVQYALAFSLYMAALRIISASVAGSFLNLVPLFGFVGASVFLHEAISWQLLLGATITVAAVTLINAGF